MQYSVGEQVEAEKTPFAWYRGTVEQAPARDGDSYVIRFDGAGAAVRSAGAQQIAPSKVRSVGARLSAAPPRLSLGVTPSAASTSPRGDASPEMQRRLESLSEQLIREQTERRRLEERLLACEHLLGDSGPLEQMRRDDSVARIERRMDELERSTRAELATNQRRVSDALVEVKKVSIASTPSYRGAPTASSSPHPTRAARELEGRVSAVETSVETTRRELERRLTTLTSRVESQSLTATLSSSSSSANPTARRSLRSTSTSTSSGNGSGGGGSEAMGELEASVMQRVEAAVGEARGASFAEMQAAEQRILTTMEKRLDEAASQSVRGHTHTHTHTHTHKHTHAHTHTCVHPDRCMHTPELSRIFCVGRYARALRVVIVLCDCCVPCVRIIGGECGAGGSWGCTGMRRRYGGDGGADTRNYRRNHAREQRRRHGRRRRRWRWRCRGWCKWGKWGEQ